MTLVFLWNRYSKKCAEEGKRFYQCRTSTANSNNKWCEENYETSHFNAVIAQKMEVDFAGQTPCKNKCRLDGTEKIQMEDVKKVLSCRDLDESNSKMVVVK